MSRLHHYSVEFSGGGKCCGIISFSSLSLATRDRILLLEKGRGERRRRGQWATKRELFVSIISEAIHMQLRSIDYVLPSFIETTVLPLSLSLGRKDASDHGIVVF